MFSTSSGNMQGATEDATLVFDNLDTIIYDKYYPSSSSVTGTLRLVLGFNGTVQGITKYDNEKYATLIFKKPILVKNYNNTTPSSYQFVISCGNGVKAVVAKETMFRTTNSGGGETSGFIYLTGGNCLKTVDIKGWDGVYLGTSTSPSYYIFNTCYYLKDVVIRRTDMVQPVAPTADGKIFSTGCYYMNGVVDRSYNPNGEKGNIWVPDELVDAYKETLG